MTNEFLIALYIIGVGIAFAGASTYFYQSVWKQQAALRFDGDNVFVTIAHLSMSFVCGPFIMLHMGWSRDSAGGMQMSQALLSAFIAFGWSFVIGLGVLWFYMGVLGF
ncbi:DUF6949 family protein [Maritalea sp.]|uniref:DUF6949 family protein n=1 Tax=Maritalea sp. TaxID=2003361 RepID=UPI003EFAD07B